MNIVHKIISFLTVYFILITSAHASEGIWAKDIQAILDKNNLSKDQYGIEIRNVKGDKVYFSANAKQGFNPASVLKIFISTVALEEFGPHYKFQTQIKKSGKNICLIGNGDPSLVYEDLFLMSEDFLRSPLPEKNTIDQLIVDESFFPTTYQYNGEFDDDSQRSFTAPISGLSLNYNSVTIIVKPSTNGSKASVYTEPRSNYFVIHNQTKTTKSGKTIGVDVDAKDDHVDITVSGIIGENEKDALIYRAVTNPPIYAGMILKDLLSRSGITVNHVVKEKCPANATDVVNFKSKPLAQTITNMNKFSNNFIAETILYQLGEKAASESGMAKMLAWAKLKNLPMENVVVQNASGLSRENSLTPNFLWNLLAYARNTFQTYPELMSSLPIGGLDGTLHRRFRGESLQGKVRAKSGSLKGSVSLVGAVDTVQKGELLFVFLFETRGKTAPQIQYIEERILEKVAALGKN